MALNSTSVSGPSPNWYMENTCRHPWDTYVAPFKMAPNVWFIGGNNWVACYLIETSEGCILIDTAVHESVYMMIDNIYKIGHKPTDIKKILLSHAHIDHIGGAAAMKQVTGAQVYMSRRDVEEYLHKRPELATLSDQYTCCLFDPDCYYDDNIPIVLGDTVIHSVATPGHTPGTTSFYFDVTTPEGKTLTCAMHGGIGLNTLSKKWFLENDQPESLLDEYIQQLRMCDTWKVDITLPSHTNQVGILPLIPEDRTDYTPFVDAGIWHELMAERLERGLKQKAENEAYCG